MKYFSISFSCDADDTSEYRLNGKVHSVVFCHCEYSKSISQIEHEERARHHQKFPDEHGGVRPLA